jgi:type I restriction enzyme S subunit
VKRLKRVFSETNEKARDGDEQLAATQKYGVISQSQFMKDEDQKLVLALKGTDNFKHVEQDDFVISLRAFEGGIERSNQSGCVSPAYTVLRSGGELAPSYSAKLLKTAAFIAQISMTYDGIREGKAIKFKDAGPVFLPIPPADEQADISNFIDDAIRKIDLAISSQERMIELLKERRSVIITQAVTKGLDPQAKMKDSGDPRLGLIPEKWEAIPLRYLGRLNGGAGFPDDEQLGRGGDIDFYKVKDLGAASPDGQMSGSDNSVNEEKARRLGAYIFKPDSILFAKVGAALLMNRFRLSKSRFCADNNVMGFEPMQAKIAASYCYFAMQTIDFSVIVNPGTVPSINERQVSSIRIPVPSLEEQSLIAKKLNKVLSTLDELSGKAATCVNLLKERRSALITQAVTGQIDVR